MLEQFGLERPAHDRDLLDGDLVDQRRDQPPGRREDERRVDDEDLADAFRVVRLRDVGDVAQDALDGRQLEQADTLQVQDRERRLDVPAGDLGAPWEPLRERLLELVDEPLQDALRGRDAHHLLDVQLTEHLNVNGPPFLVDAMVEPRVDFLDLPVGILVLERSDDLLDAELFPPLLVVGNHLLRLGRVELARAQEPTDEVGVVALLTEHAVGLELGHHLIVHGLLFRAQVPDLARVRLRVGRRRVRHPNVAVVVSAERAHAVSLFAAAGSASDHSQHTRRRRR